MISPLTVDDFDLCRTASNQPSIIRIIRNLCIAVTKRRKTGLTSGSDPPLCDNVISRFFCEGTPGGTLSRCHPFRRKSAPQHAKIDLVSDPAVPCQLSCFTPKTGPPVICPMNPRKPLYGKNLPEIQGGNLKRTRSVHIRVRPLIFFGTEGLAVVVRPVHWKPHQT